MKPKNFTQTLALVAMMVAASIQLSACGGGGSSGTAASTPVTSASSSSSSSDSGSSGGTPADDGSSGNPPPASDTTVPTIVLSQPTTGTSYTASTSSVTIAGTASDNVALTQVAWTNNLGGSGSVAAGGSTASLNFVVSLASGINVITITATDSSGNTTQRQLTVTYAPAASGSVTLTWDPVTATPVSGYRVYYGTSSGSYQQVISIGNSTTYALSGLTSGTRYYFVVTAVDTSGTESGYSNEVYKDVL